MATRWQKIMKNTKCTEAEARQASVVLEVLELLRSTTLKLESERVRQYVADKTGDAIIEIVSGETL